MKRNLSLMGGALCAAVLLGASSASAHIGMEGALKSRTTGIIPGYDNEQKMSPCDGPRSSGPVYTFQPGTTITLSISEAVAHPSYFRIAFDNDGEDGFKEPKSIKPIDPARKCPFDKDDQCGESDFCNVYEPDGAKVLWDNLNPHKTASSGTKYTWNVKLPDVECENCTIQIIQVMEDTVHGAYCPQGSCANSSASLEDIYHRCINIKLKKGATNSPGATTSPVNNMGIQCTGAPVTDAGVNKPDGGAVADAGVSDAGSQPSTGGAAGGTGGATSDGGAAEGGTAGGTGTAAGGAAQGGAAGGTGSAAGGAAQAGTAGGTGSAAGGAAQGGAAGGAGTAGGGAAPGGNVGGTNTAGGTTGGGAAPNTGGVAGGTPTMGDDDDDGCSVAFGRTGNSGALLGLSLIAGAAFLRRRRRTTRDRDQPRS